MNKEERELYELICEKFGATWVERTSYVEVDEIKYSYEELTELDVISEGKYEYGGTIYAVGILDEKRGCGIKEPLFYMRQDFSRTGYYYNEFMLFVFSFNSSIWETEYETPYLVEKKEVTVTRWEAV